MDTNKRQKLQAEFTNRSIKHQEHYPLSTLIYDDNDIRNALKVFIDFVNNNEFTPLIQANAALSFMGVGILLIAENLQIQGIINADEYITIMDNLTDYKDIAIAYSVVMGR